MEYKDYAFALWDTAGQEKYNSLAASYLRRGRIVLLCFALDARSSFENVPKWVKLIDENSPDDAKIILVGTKLDLALGDRRTVAQSEGRSCAVNVNRGNRYVEVSAQSGEGVNALKDMLVAEVESLTPDNATALLEEKEAKKCC
jgi:small GTP-binding protein